MEKKTPLYEEHVRSSARIVPFAGFLMPIQYAGIIEEHQAVRTGMGMFDLSHMGEFEVRGPGAIEAIDSLMTNDIAGLEVGQIRYTPMTYPDAGIVDDLLVYRFEDRLMLVVNASNIEKDIEWIRGHVPASAQVEDISDSVALIAVQGPQAPSFLQSFTDVNLSNISYYHFAEGDFGGVRAIISRTGYTGEDGFELYVSDEDAPSVWRTLLDRGAEDGLRPVGLGARDTLRLEAGYMLYGNDIDETTNPLEAGLGWTVKLGGGGFSGRDVLVRQKEAGLPRRMVALEMLDRSIPRPHQAILVGGSKIGELTSGTFSPTLNKGVGLGYVETGVAKTGTLVEIEIRNQRHPARIARKPVYKRDGS